jgi:hypothetical protein
MYTEFVLLLSILEYCHLQGLSLLACSVPKHEAYPMIANNSFFTRAGYQSVANPPVFEDQCFYSGFPSLRDCLCGLVVRVPGYRSRGPGFDARRYQIF